MGLRIGFHSHVPAIARNGQVYTPGYQGRFIDGLAENFEEVLCFLHTPSSNNYVYGDYPILSKNVRFIPIGVHSSIPRRVLLAKEYVKNVRAAKDRMDVFLIRGPSPLLGAIANAVKPVPVALLLVGDYRYNIGDIQQPMWRKALIWLWARWNYYEQIQVAKSGISFVNSVLLYDDLRAQTSNLFMTTTATIFRSDFFKRQDTCLQRPVHLLYVGRLTRAKGLVEMARAVSLLVKAGEDVVFDLVGQMEPGDDVMDEINRLSIELDIRDRVKYHGYRSLGPELFEFYRKSDIFVIPSYFEGFPRVVWEALANSLPVIASDVGSIRVNVGQVVELVPPKSPVALKESVQKILQHTDFRKKLIRNGYILAEENTFENSVKKMSDSIKNFCRDLY